MQYQVLGGLAVFDADGRELDLGGPKQRAVLAALLLADGTPVSSDALADRVWGDDLPASATASLQAYISNLRRVLEPDRPPRTPATVLVSRPSGYALLTAGRRFDLAEFERAARPSPTADGDRLATIDAALASWGQLLPELAGVWWVDERDAYVRRLRRDLQTERMHLVLEQGIAPTEAVNELSELAELHPDDEHVQVLLALARYRAGRQREALAGIAAFRDRLLDEAGVEPGPDLRQVEVDILRHADHLRIAPAAMEHDRSASMQPEPEPIAAAAPTPAAPTSSPFYGRQRELARLRRHADDDGGSAVLITGEPGIGKTRLVEELVAGSSRAVAWGRCPESAAQVPYWVFTQILRQLEGAGVVEPVDFGELASVASAANADSELDASARRLRLHDAVTRHLASATRPALMVIDDLQWADPASLRLLEHLAGEVRSLPVMLVAMSRPRSSPPNPDVEHCIAELGRHPDSIRFELTGLELVDVTAWLRDSIDPGVTLEQARQVQIRSNGNPFFVGELASSRQRPVSEPVPGAITDAVRQRVGSLPEPAGRALRVAAVLGREVTLTLLADVLTLDQLDVLESLEPAFAAGLLEQAEHPGIVRFSHALVAESLESEIGIAQRTRWHARAATELERRGALDDPDRVPALAHHAFLGLAAGTAELAVAACRRAAGLATRQLADSEAAYQLDRALSALSQMSSPPTSHRLELLLELGDAAMRLDDLARAAAALVPAMSLAIELGDADAAVTAARTLNVPGVWQAGEVGEIGAEIVPAIEAVLGVVTGDGDRALLLALQAEYGYWIMSGAEADRLTGEAADLARRAGDPTVLADVLAKRVQCIWRTAQAEARQATADELRDVIATHPLPRATAAAARLNAAAASFQGGDMATARGLVDAVRAEPGHTISIRVQAGFFAAALDGWSGRLSRAELALAEAHDLHRAGRQWGAELFHNGCAAPTVLEQDRLDRAIALVTEVDFGRYASTLGAVAGFVLFEAGAADEAVGLADLVPPDIDVWFTPGVVAAALLNHVTLDRRSAVVELIERADRIRVPVAAMGSGASIGDLDHARAAAHRYLGDTARAVVHADRSVEFLSSSGSGPWLVRSLILRWHLTADDADLARARRIADDLQLPLQRRRLAELGA